MGDNSDLPVKIVGQINLGQFSGGKIPLIDDKKPFRIVAMSVSFWDQSPVEMKFDVDDEESDEGNRFFSLLIGSNGVGKSSLLREVIDMLVYAKSGEENAKNKQIEIQWLKYTLGGHEFQIERAQNGFKYYCDGDYVRSNIMSYPLIIASTMGMFDKFPYRKPNGPYDTPMYSYVGPRASTNIIASKTYLMMQMLANLNYVKQKRQLTKIAEVLNFIGYDTTMVLRFKLKDSTDSKVEASKQRLSKKCKQYLELINNQIESAVDLDFADTTLQYAKNLHLAEINELRQAKLLSWQRCYLYRDGKEIECNNLSSGEFNMLSIVMSVVLAANNRHVLILLDEPEISQHPNWQIDIISNLDKALEGYNCHFMIATHCHFLVSNLPTGRSNVIDIEKDTQRIVEVLPLKADTYGWSAEEVLLRAFKMTTDRNRYLAEVVGGLLNKMAKNEIAIAEVESELKFLKRVSVNLSDIDPMKKIINTIVNEFE